MFTELVRITCIFLACRGGLAKYQTCLIFHQPSTTLHPDCGSAHLETVLLWISTDCRLQIVGYTSSLVLRCYRFVLKVNITINITDLTWTLPVKMGNLPVFSCRAGNISAGQARNTFRQAINKTTSRYTKDNPGTV